MEDKIHITVDKDWGSTGIWVKGCRTWGNAKYQDFPIPDWLIKRFEYWSDRYDSHISKGCEFEEEEWQLLEAYKLSLAMDLRRVLDDRFVVYSWDNELDERREVFAYA